MKIIFSFIKKLFFFFAFILILGIVLFKIFINPSLFEKPLKYTSAPITDKKGIECEKSGGEWIAGLFSKEFFCNKKPADGGKTCKDSSDCLSNKCILYKDDNVAKCASYQTIFGCYSLINKNVKPKTICVD
ncbi:MAG: hypothetical protein ACD_26C00031G0008 [uncultured bacterium]|nr:MAG: hypothetical protein ACD_26C00031G0008 [uncultured bacterium]